VGRHGRETQGITGEAPAEAGHGKLTCHGGHIQGGALRETVLSNLASQAATDPVFLRQARKDLEGTLARNGYHLTDEELRVVEDLRRRTAGMSDEELARALAGGLQSRSGSPPARPTAPSWRGTSPARPARPGA
jgi:hypothetical protein